MQLDTLQDKEDAGCTECAKTYKFGLKLNLLFLYTRHDMFEFPSTGVPYLWTDFISNYNYNFSTLGSIKVSYEFLNLI